MFDGPSRFCQRCFRAFFERGARGDFFGNPFPYIEAGVNKKINKRVEEKKKISAVYFKKRKSKSYDGNRRGYQKKKKRFKNEKEEKIDARTRRNVNKLFERERADNAVFYLYKLRDLKENKYKRLTSNN